ncbi:MAG: type IV secretion system protein [Variovorax sp.]|nr:type IV secretion system protein [Variovorax sp.]
MTMPFTDVSNFVFFQLINDHLRDEINTFQWNLLTSTARFIGAIGLMLLSVWIALQGLRVVTGRSRQPMMALVGDSLRAVLILGIATGAAGVSSNLYWTLTDGTASAITALASQHADSPYANIDKNLAYMQAMFSAIDSLASGGDPSVESAKTRALWFSSIGIAGPGVIGGSLLLLNKIALALFVGFGPLFVLCLLFEKTKALFEKWLLYGIGTVFSLAVLSFMVGLANNIVQAVAMSFLARFAVLLADTGSLGGASTAGEGITSLAMQQGGIGLVLTTLIVSAPPMAAAFFRGVLGQFQVFSAFGMIGRGTEAGANHVRRTAATADTTGQGAADQSALSESDRQLMTVRFQRASGDSNAALDYIKRNEWSGLTDTSAPQTPGQRYVDVYGGDSLMTSGLADGGPLATELAGRFAKGVAHGAVDMVWQPVAQVLDLGQVAYGTAYGFATGGLYEPRWFSAIGQNYEAGMAYGETVTRAVLGSNPVTGVGMASFDLAGSALKGDWGGVAEGAGGLVGGFALAKYGQRYLAPEPGAQLGFYRRTSSIDVRDPSGMAAPLPAKEVGNFTSAEPVYLGGRTLNRVFDSVDFDRAVGGAKPNGGYWTEKAYADETNWRAGVAVPAKQPWNNGTLQGEWRPADGWGWGGKAAPQVLGSDYSTKKYGFSIGWLQRGGDYQIFVPNSYSPAVIPPSAIKVSPTPWSKP